MYGSDFRLVALEQGEAGAGDLEPLVAGRGTQEGSGEGRLSCPERTGQEDRIARTRERSRSRRKSRGRGEVGKDDLGLHHVASLPVCRSLPQSRARPRTRAGCAHGLASEMCANGSMTTRAVRPWDSYCVGPGSPALPAWPRPRLGGLDRHLEHRYAPSMGQTVTTEVAIIGAGPVGLFAVFELGMVKLSSVLIDALDEIGGQCTALYPEKPIYDIPAHPRIEASELVAQLERQIAPFRAARLLGRRVTALSGSAGAFALGTDGGDVIHAKAVVVAAGAGAFGPNRPPLEGIAAYEASGCVQYYVRRKEGLRGKRVVIAGGGDSAVDWALALKDSAHVTVVHRRARFRAAPESTAQLDAAAARGEIEMAIPYQLHALHGAGGRLEAVEVATLQGETRLLPAHVLLPFFGLSMDLGPIAHWGLVLERHHVVIDPATCQTSVPGVFAIGDVAVYPGKLKLILQGFSEAAIAAHAIFGVVHPGQALHFEYSTTTGVPQA
jgi:thioredoxin reductase (NADPH)